jgi:hypothetical protein
MALRVGPRFRRRGPNARRPADDQRAMQPSLFDEESMVGEVRHGSIPIYRLFFLVHAGWL